MIIERQGDIFQNTNGIIIHGCNAMGVMGAGVAKLVKQKYPAAFKAYRHYCDSASKKGYKLLGSVQVIPINRTLIIANAITQTLPGPYADETAIYTTLESVFTLAKKLQLPIHSVKIGCGIGGLQWEKVREIYAIIELQYPEVECNIWSL